jgi:hypothetical protein
MDFDALNGISNTPGGERNRDAFYSLQRVQKINRNYEQVGTMALSPKSFKNQLDKSAKIQGPKKSLVEQQQPSQEKKFHTFTASQTQTQ